MAKRILLVASADPAAALLLKIEVLDAEMVHPGWIRFTIASLIPHYEGPTVCWYRIPDDAKYVELQDQVTDEEIIAMAQWAVLDRGESDD